MKAAARRAIFAIRRCIAADRFSLAAHFYRRMELRGLFWPDVMAVVQRPTRVRSQGKDKFGRSKWIIRGKAAFGGEIEIVCTIEVDETGTEFITLYWED